MALEFRLASPTLALPPAKPSLRLATDVLQGGRDVQQANIPKRLQKDRQRPFQRLFEATQPICLSDAERSSDGTGWISHRERLEPSPDPILLLQATCVPSFAPGKGELELNNPKVPINTGYLACCKPGGFVSTWCMSTKPCFLLQHPDPATGPLHPKHPRQTVSEMMPDSSCPFNIPSTEGKP